MNRPLASHGRNPVALPELKRWRSRAAPGRSCDSFLRIFRGVGPAAFVARAAFAAVAAFMIAVTAPSRLSAQSTFSAACDDPVVTGLNARDVCIAAAQAVASAQPIIGLGYAGGSTNMGYAGGPRLGFTPARASLGVRINAVRFDVPDIVTDVFEDPDGFLETYGAVLPVVIVDGSLSLTEGTDHTPGLGGIGALSLIGTFSFVPGMVGGDGLGQTDYALGVGARIQLLRESFTAPAAAITIVRRNMKSVSYGNVCPGGVIPVPNPLPGEGSPEIAGCFGGGDPGEARFDLSNWSGRLTASKSIAGFSALAGVGYDSYESSAGFGARSTVNVGGATPVFRFDRLTLESSRWSVFGGISLNLLVASISAEAGWQQGMSPVADFDSLGSSFDPRSGVLFGSFGARLTL